MYNKKVMEYFKNPRNHGEMKKPDAVGEAINPSCGDKMKLYLKIRKKDGEEFIKDIKFQTLGCVAAIATSSVFTEMIKGKSLTEAFEISNQDIIEELEGLPTPKKHCSLLAVRAFKEAYYHYLQDQEKDIPEELKKAHQQNQRFAEVAAKNEENLNQELNEKG